MAQSNEGYTARQLAAAIDMQPRTIRSWVAAGLLAAPRKRGPGARYAPDAMTRVRAIAALMREFRHVETVRSRIKRASAAEIEALAARARGGEPDRGASATGGERAPPPAPSYPARRWERVELLPGLELHIDLDAGQALRRVAMEIYAHYGPRAG